MLKLTSFGPSGQRAAPRGAARHGFPGRVAPVLRPVQSRGPRAPRFNERNADSGEEQYIMLPLDPTELLGLSGKSSYHLCDIMDVYNDLRDDVPTEGFSDGVLAGRLEVLETVKDEAVYQGGRVALADKGGMTIPVQLLPSALVLLMQIGASDMVISLALPLLENWEVRKAYKRDILLALALAYCSRARDLLTNEQTVDGCLALEEALHLLQSGGAPPLAPRVAAEIDSALRGLAVPRVLDQLRAQATPEAASARKRAVAMLRHMLHAPHEYKPAAAALAPGAEGKVAGGVNADYVRLVVGSMGAREIVDMADWRAVARNAKGTFWVYPGLLQIAAHAHATVGFLDRDPALVQTAQVLLRGATGPAASAETLVLRAVCGVLMGSTDEALVQLQAARRAPLDTLLPWPQEVAVGSDADADPVVATGMPVAQEAYGFVCGHSPDDGSGDLLPGLCLLTELWLSKIGFAMFPDTAADALNCSLSAYFNNPRVQQQLARGEGGVPAAAAAGAIANTLAAVADGVSGQLGRAAAVVKSALSAPPAPAGATQAATGGAPAAVLTRGGGGGNGGFGDSASPRQQRGRGGWDESEGFGDVPPSSAAGYPDQWPPVGLARGPGGPLDVAADALAAPIPGSPRGARSAAAVAAWDDGLPRAGAAPAWAQDAAGYSAAQQAGGDAMVADIDPWGARRPQQREPAGLAGAARQLLAVAARPPVIAAVAGAALFAAFVLQQGRRGNAAAGYSGASSTAASVASTAAAFDAAAATRLVRAYQEARWRALGPDWDASAASSVAGSAALNRLRSQADSFAARGWFQRFKLHAITVTAVHPAGPGAARVEATIRESASTFGVDGRRGDSLTSAYDVEYKVKAGADGRWRVVAAKVLGQEPGSGGSGWIGGLFGN